MLTGKKPIVVVGSINLDFATRANHIPSAGETVIGIDLQMHPGGKGANQAVAVAKLGWPVQMIGKLGSDVFGEQLWRHLKSAGVGLRGVERIEGPSGAAVIIVTPGGDNCIVATPAANAHVTPGYIDLHLDIIRNAGMVLTQLEIPIETVEHLADVCFREGVPLILDPAPAQHISSEILQRVQWFTPNETEASYYAGCTSSGLDSSPPASTAHSLLKQGPAGVLLKMGSDGAYLATAEVTAQIDAIQVNAVDTTAAGDAFNGAFAVGLLHGRTPLESARFAAVAAALSVTRPGAQTSMPTLNEVEKKISDLRHHNYHVSPGKETIR
jgi:ribokinase